MENNNNVNNNDDHAMVARASCRWGMMLDDDRRLAADMAHEHGTESCLGGLDGLTCVILWFFEHRNRRLIILPLACRIIEIRSREEI